MAKKKVEKEEAESVVEPVEVPVIETVVEEPKPKPEPKGKEKISIGDLVYEKPVKDQEQSETFGKPWSVMGLFDDKASCLIQGKDGLQRNQVFAIKDLTKVLD